MPPAPGIDLCGIGSLDTATGMFQLATTDMVLYPPGNYPVEIKGFITGYPSHSNSHTFTFTLVDPCSSATVSVPAQIDPPDHSYTVPTSFTALYTVSDSRCLIEYACVTPTSGLDPCAIGPLDATTGVFQITTTDKISFPPGIFYVKIKGSIVGHPSQSNSNSFTIHMEENESNFSTFAN